MKWCEHCTEGIDNKGQSYRTTCWNVKSIEENWNYCPICGAKRPEEPKTLAKKVINKIPFHKEEDAEEIVSIVREHILKLIKEWGNDREDTRDVEDVISEIK